METAHENEIFICMDYNDFQRYVNNTKDPLDSSDRLPIIEVQECHQEPTIVDNNCQGEDQKSITNPPIIRSVSWKSPVNIADVDSFPISLLQHLVNLAAATFNISLADPTLEFRLRLIAFGNGIIPHMPVMLDNDMEAMALRNHDYIQICFLNRVLAPADVGRGPLDMTEEALSKINYDILKLPNPLRQIKLEMEAALDDALSDHHLNDASSTLLSIEGTIQPLSHDSGSPIKLSSSRRSSSYDAPSGIKRSSSHDAPLGTRRSSNDTPPLGTRRGSNETPLFGTRRGSNETPLFATRRSSNETPLFATRRSSNETPLFGTRRSLNETSLGSSLKLNLSRRNSNETASSHSDDIDFKFIDSQGPVMGFRARPRTILKKAALRYCLERQLMRKDDPQHLDTLLSHIVFKRNGSPLNLLMTIGEIGLQDGEQILVEISSDLKNSE